MALAPNTGFGLLNPGTTVPKPAPTVAPNPVGGISIPNNPNDPGYGQAFQNTVNQWQQALTAQGGPQVPGAGGPSTTPPPQQNLTGLINSFPGVSNSLALEQQGLGQLDANLQAERNRAIINFGDPALASMAGFGLDPQAGAFAQQNYMSGNATLARLNKAHQLAAQGIINALASHGILNSGDLGYREGQENQTYGNNVYDAQQSVLTQLANLYSNYLSQRNSLQNGPIQAQLQALTDYLSNPDAYASLVGNQTQPTTTTAPPKATATKTTTKKTTAQPGDAISRYIRNNL